MNDTKPTLVSRLLTFIRKYFFWLLIITAVIILALVFEAGRYSVYRAHPELTSTEQASAILTNVGELIELPSEQPTMATINDAASAKQQQPFLTNALNGDILIVYPNAGEALLYRPSTNKLIAVGPVNAGAQTGSQTIQQLPPPTTASTSNATTTKTKK